MSLADIEKRRAERKASLKEKRDEQYAKDLEALDALEVQYGDDSVAAVETPGYVPGLPTMAVSRAPTKDEYKRFRDMVVRSKGGPAQIEAQDLLADSCVVYPDKETYKAMREAFAGLHVSMAVAAVKLADGKAAEEGKG